MLSGGTAVSPNLATSSNISSWTGSDNISCRTQYSIPQQSSLQVVTSAAVATTTATTITPNLQQTLFQLPLRLVLQNPRRRGTTKIARMMT
eukprot:8209124-Pyramimonas_sp.AAC.1